MMRIRSALAIAACGTVAIACANQIGERPLSQPVTVQISSTDSLHPIRFNVQAKGGLIELQEHRAPGMHGTATNAQLNALTPATVVMRPGTRSATITAQDQGSVFVAAIAGEVRLTATGKRVDLVPLKDRVEIRVP